MKASPATAATVALFAALSVLDASDAAACWDGYAAGMGDLSITHSGVGEWSPAEARDVARWGSRIEALIPEGAELTINFNVVECEGEACNEMPAIELEDPADWKATFEKVAQAFRVSHETRKNALALEPTVYTVQVFAGSQVGALKAKQRVVDLESSFFGFYVAGGFPASNDDAHVLLEGDVHSVVVGAFLDKASADAARDELANAGFKGFVRALPLAPTVDEKSFSMAG